VKLDSESKTQKKPKAEGYPDNATILFKQLPVSTYMQSKNPAIALQDAYEVSYYLLIIILFKYIYSSFIFWYHNIPTLKVLMNVGSLTLKIWYLKPM